VHAPAHKGERAQRLSRDAGIMTAATAGEADDAVRGAFGPMADCQAVRPRPGARAGQKPPGAPQSTTRAREAGDT